MIGRAMLGCKYNRKVVFVQLGIKLNRQHFPDVRNINLLVDRLDQFLLRFAQLGINGQLITDLIHIGNDLGNLFRSQLAAGLIIDLIPVVFLGIVGSRNDDAAGALQIAHRIAQLRGRPQRGEQVTFNTH